MHLKVVKNKTKQKYIQNLYFFFLNKSFVLIVGELSKFC